MSSKLPAPWRLEVTNDEAHHHLKSWRNRYGTNDVFPIFLERLKATGRNRNGFTATLQGWYRRHPELVGRALFIMIDPQPPLWPTLAEAIEFASHSSLVLQRVPSLLASLAALVFAYQIGRRLKDVDLGLWLSGLFCIGLLSQVYAGIARPYAIAQCLVLAVVYCFIRQRQQSPKSFLSFLAIALVAQSSQWMAWAVIGPLVAVELYVQYKKDHSAGRLLRGSWWYGLGSLILFGEMLVQLQNPTISGQAHRPGLMELLDAVSWASPFSQMAVMGRSLQWANAICFLLLLIISSVIALRSSSLSNSALRCGLMLSFAASIAAPMFLGASIRFLMTYLVVPTIITAIGIHWALYTEFVRRTGLTMLLLLFGTLSVIQLSAPYKYKVWSEPRFSTIASDLKKRLQPGDAWLGYPYYLANDLYRFEPLPEPLLPQSEVQFNSQVKDLWSHGKSVLVVTSTDDSAEVLADGERLGEYEGRELTIRLIKLLPPPAPQK